MEVHGGDGGKERPAGEATAGGGGDEAGGEMSGVRGVVMGVVCHAAIAIDGVACWRRHAGGTETLVTTLGDTDAGRRRRWG